MKNLSKILTEFHFVSVMVEKNVSVNVIREFVGHSEDSREIEKTYLHVMHIPICQVFDLSFNF